MSFSDHKITAFTHKIADLPDQPNLPADELKARFDSSPEELRQSVNSICDDADRLENRVDGIIAQTFEGEITREMLEEDVRDELDGKADADDVAAETQSLDARLDTVETALPQKCEVYIGSYTGTGLSDRNNSQTINIGFSPRAVIVFNKDGSIDNSGCAYGGIASAVTANSPNVRLSDNGFTVYCSTGSAELNRSDMQYGYIAFK